MSELHYAFRTLLRSPGFTAAAVLTLALGIGANTALFSLISGLLFKALPVRNPEQLVVFRPGLPPAQSWSYPAWDQIRQHANMFGGVFAFANNRMNLAPDGVADFVDSMWVSGSFFSDLGVSPIVGRVIGAADDQPGGGPDGPVAVVGHDFWLRRFNGTPDVLGRTLRLEGVTFTIVGVAPRGFHGLTVGRTFDVAIPFGAEPMIRGASSNLHRQSFSWIVVMARTRPGMSIEAATTALRSVQSQVREATLPAAPATQPSYLRVPFVASPANTGVSPLRNQYRQPLIIMMVTASFVLLITCANIANLLLARAVERRHELSLRLAIGASRWRIGRQWLVESLLLSSAGALLGLLLASVFTPFLLSQLSTRNMRVFLDVAPDWRVLTFVAVVAVVTAAFFGTAPAVRASALDPIDALKARGRGAGGAHGHFIDGLLVAQVALSLVLVAGAGLFVRSFTALTSVGLGFDVSRLVIANINNSPAQIPPARRLPLLQQIQQEVQRIPDVRSAALSVITPFGNRELQNEIEIVGGQRLPDGQRTSATNFVGPSWFATYGVPLLAGRDFTDGDRVGTREVVIVNQAFVRAFLEGANPIGRVVRDVYAGGKATGPEREIVGLVADAAYATAREGIRPVMYQAVGQFEDAILLPIMAVSVSTAGSPTLLVSNVAKVIRTIDSSVSVTVRPLSADHASSLNQERLLALLSSFFGLLGLVLACIGLYGVMSYAVNQRRGELGIRIALGADPWNVAALVLGRMALLVSLGIAAGASLSWWMARYIAPSLLFGLQPRDLSTVAGAAVALLAVGALTAFLPSRRAARIDPLEMLKEA